MERLSITRLGFAFAALFAVLYGASMLIVMAGPRDTVIAFIVALVTEIYGFPLITYLLTHFLGIEIPLDHISGHLCHYSGFYDPMAYLYYLDTVALRDMDASQVGAERGTAGFKKVSGEIQRLYTATSHVFPKII